jgi:S-adenosylmethionine hydrolase
MRTLFLVLGLFLSAPTWADQPLVFQSDFGVKDGAVAAMKGVAVGVSADLSIHDLTHEIPTFNVWEAALRLDQTAAYWPPGTVFVSVVDPGVGTERKSVVLKTKSRHYFVTPDNGTLTFVAENLGIEAVREIDEAVNRRKDSEASYTFHGRDVYAYTGARLAAGTITFEEVGAALPASVVSIEYQKATIENGVLSGNIPILDVQFGNVWTNIDRSTFRRLELRHGDSARVVIRHGGEIVFDATLPYVATFGDVGLREPLIYLNSLNNVALALNQGDFAGTFHIASGSEWSIELRK